MCLFCHKSKSLFCFLQFPWPHQLVNLRHLASSVPLYRTSSYPYWSLFVLLLLQWKHKSDAWLANIRANYKSSLRREERSWTGLKIVFKDGFKLTAGISGEKSKDSSSISDRIIILGQSQGRAEKVEGAGTGTQVLCANWPPCHRGRLPSLHHWFMEGEEWSLGKLNKRSEWKHVRKCAWRLPILWWFLSLTLVETLWD